MNLVENEYNKAAKADNATFLKAVRAGDVNFVVQLLESGLVDVHTSNSNGLNALHLAAKDGFSDIVKELLRYHCNIESRSKKGNTALHVGALAGQLEVVQVLVTNGADINVQSSAGFTPLYMAAQENHASVVRYLLDHGANATLATEDDYTPMAIAVQQNNHEIVDILTEHGQRGRSKLSPLHVAAKKNDFYFAMMLLQNETDAKVREAMVNECTKSGFAPLHIAAHYGNASIAKVLLQYNANVNAKAKNLITPLHVSSKLGRANLVELLINHDAIIDCKTKDGLTPLHCAARSGFDEVVELLLRAGSLIQAKTRHGLSPLHTAAQGDHVATARILLAHRAIINDTTVDLLTPLHVCAHCGNVSTAKLLLEKNCEVNPKALNGFTPLHIACKKNRLRIIELLLQSGASINTTTESGLTPLHVSSFMGYTDIVKFLLQKGSDPNAVTGKGETPLHLATRGNQLETMELLLQNKAKVDARAKENQSPLHAAARTGSVDAVLLLLQYRADINAKTKESYTPLHIAAKEGHDEVLQVLLERGADQNIRTLKNFTPLHMAAKYGSLGAANSLISNGADPNVDGKNGLTPLHVAAHYNQVDMVSFLLSKKSSPHAIAKNGYTPLHIAAKYDELEVASLLLQYKAKPNAESKNGFTALHLASQEGHMDMVALLLENKAKVNHQSRNGLTAMHLAAQEDHVPVAETLVQYSGDIDVQTKAGYTPLHTACHFGQLNMIEFLLKRGANVKAATKAGYTPLHQAAQQGHVLVTQMLLKHKADPNDLTAKGESALWIADQLGFISVTEVLRPLTTVVMTQHMDDHYKPHAPELMLEQPMSDEEDDDKGEDIDLAEQSYTYLTTGDDLHGFADDKAIFQMNDRESFSPRTQEDMKWMLGKRDVNDKMMIHNAETSAALMPQGKEIVRPPLKKNAAQDNDAVIASKHPKTTEDQRFVKDSMTRTDELAEQTSIGKIKPGKKKKQPMSPQLNNSNYIETHFDDGINEQINHEAIVNGSPMNGHSLLLESAPNYFNERPSTFLSKESKPLKETGASIQQTNITKAQPIPPENLEPYFNESKPVRNAMDIKQQQSTPATPGLGIPVFKSNISETDSQMFGSTYSGMSFASSYDPDNVAVVRQPLFSGFLVSFLVDARGGAMRGCRHSGIRIIVPPGRASQPTRVTCKLVRPEKVPQMPTLLEGEALASRVLVIGPAGAKFLGPVILEVPHFASLNGNEREIIVLRSENGHVWKEHNDLATIDTMQKALCGSFDDLESAEDLYHRRITRIITSEFPKYFALVTRIRREMVTLGPSGGSINSTLVPEVQAIFPKDALTKPIKLSLQTQPIPESLVRKLVGDRVTVSPIATIEPRRRKFHKPIKVTLPLPPSVVASNPALDKSPSLRLLCSMSDPSEITEWEDITGSTPMTLSNNCVSFPIAVSARYWIINTPRYKEAVQIANPLFEEIMLVPFVANFVVFAKRRDALDGQLRIFCMTDDKMVKTLEVQEKFVEVARSRDIEVYDNKPQWVEIHGNLIPVLKSDRQPFVNFRSFRENRLSMNVRVRDMSQDPNANIMFMPESHDDLIQLHQRLGQTQPPIANLDIKLPSIEDQRRVDTASMRDAAELQDRLKQLKQLNSPNEEIISKAELKLTDIAEYLDYDWIPLARQLKISEHDIARTQADYGYIPEQALVMLHLWADKGTDVSGNTLARALKEIDRPDIIEKCIKSVEIVTDDKEKELSRSICKADKDQFVPSIRIIGGSFESNEAQRLSRDMSTETNDPTINKMNTSLVSKAEFETFDNQADEPAESMIFEDWVHRQSMNSQKPKSDSEFPIVPQTNERISSPMSRLEDKKERSLAVKVEIEEDSWEREDGGSVQRQTVTKKFFRHSGIDTEMESTSNLDHIEVEEEWLELPAGVTDPEEGKYVTRCFEEVHEVEHAATGVPVKRTINRTVVMSLDGLDDVAGDIVRNSIQSAYDIVANDLNESDVVAVRVYTDTVEKDPEIETDVKETEEVLEDGTIVRRRIIQTKQKKTIIKRVVMEGPEDELPSSKEQAQEMLKRAEYNEPTWTNGSNEPKTTDVQEFEEVQPDGTIIKRRIVTTTEQQLTSERIMLEDGLDSSFLTESDGRLQMDMISPSESDDDEKLLYGKR